MFTSDRRWMGEFPNGSKFLPGSLQLLAKCLATVTNFLKLVIKEQYRRLVDLSPETRAVYMKGNLNT